MLRDVREWLDRHNTERIATVDTWMVRSLPVPTALSSTSGRIVPGTPLRDAVIFPDLDDFRRPTSAGPARGASE